MIFDKCVFLLVCGDFVCCTLYVWPEKKCVFVLAYGTVFCNLWMVLLMPTCVSKAGVSDNWRPVDVLCNSRMDHFSSNLMQLRIVSVDMLSARSGIKIGFSTCFNSRKLMKKKSVNSY